MSRKMLVAATGAVAFAAVLTVASIALAGASSPQITTARTIRLTESDITDTSLDLGKKGYSPGDDFLTYGKFTSASGRRVGSFVSSCRLVSQPKVGAAFCVLNALIPGGGVTFQGAVSFNSTRFVLAVTGGTRHYRNARGQVVIEGTDKPTSHFAFELIP